jgi:hypothetical protein
LQKTKKSAAAFLSTPDIIDYKTTRVAGNYRKYTSGTG